MRNVKVSSIRNEYRVFTSDKRLNFLSARVKEAKVLPYCLVKRFSSHARALMNPCATCELDRRKHSSTAENVN